MPRPSLVLQLIVASVLIAACAVAATAFLATITTTQSIRDQQGESLANDATIYRSLLKYAATHTDWSGVDPTVAGLSTTTGLRVALESDDGTRIADSVRSRAPLPATPSAVVDPLAVNLALQGGTDASPIDPDVVGPYALTRTEKAELKKLAANVLSCVSAYDAKAGITTLVSGRPIVVTTAASTAACDAGVLERIVVPSQAKALDDLSTLANACLKSTRTSLVTVRADFSWTRKAVSSSEKLSLPSNKTTDSCVLTARREQLASFVAPPAVLYIAAPTTAGTVGFDFGGGNQAKVAGLAGGVLALTVGLMIVMGLRIVRPLRAMTAATQRMRKGDDTVRVRIRGRNELAQLGDAFNRMSADRAEQETQRKAMISDIAHELRTPLTNIRGWLEASRDGLTQHDTVLDASLLEEALLLEHVVDDLQDLAMADAGALTIHPQTVEVRSLLEQVIASHSGSAAAKQIETELECDRELTLSVDPVRFRQAIGNLVVNAVKYTPASGRIRVTAIALGDRVSVSVADTGPGIPTDDLDHVFDRFWRAEKSRNRETGGSGLGLSIARKLVEAHGGTASATSVVGVGSVFTLTWPTGEH